MAETYLKEAVKLAKESDTVIFVGGLNHDYDVEGLDREDMKLPYNQDKVIEELLKVNPNTVVVMFAGSPVEMPWLSQTKALLWNYYSGMEGGTALAEVIFGMVNPSGKLAETFIKNADSCPAKTGINFAKDDSIEYTEGVMVGYRYYDTHDTDVNFCFGYGKSYTEFEYGNLEIKDISGESGKDILQVSFDITNTGSEAGMEAAQVYVAPMCTGSVVRPYHELKDFEKIFLNQGETKRIQILLDESDFSCYDTDMKNFVKIPGIYEIQIGASSRDIRLKAQTDIK